MLEEGHAFRDVEIEAVAKTLSCRTSKLGKKRYSCSNPKCTHIKYIYNTCKSKLCTSCGQKATEIWIVKQNAILPDCPFRHLTFTMPDLFWDIFKLNRSLLNALFTIAAGTLLTHGKNKGLTPGIFTALHTYGRQLNFNCHIHLSVAKFGVNEHGDLRVFSFPFSTIMSQWRYGVIKLLRDNFDKLTLPDTLQDDGKSRRLEPIFRQSISAQLERGHRKGNFSQKPHGKIFRRLYQKTAHIRFSIDPLPWGRRVIYLSRSPHQNTQKKDVRSKRNGGTDIKSRTRKTFQNDPLLRLSR